MESWTRGLSLVALTMAIHATGIALIGFALRSIRRLEERNRRSIRVFAMMIVTIGISGLLLTILHDGP
jgi:hypothetical protein